MQDLTPLFADLALATVGIAATLAPVAGDGSAAALKIAARLGKHSDEAVVLAKEAAVAKEGVDLSLKFKAGWTSTQQAEAVAKAEALTVSRTVVTESERAGTAAAMSRYRKAEQVGAGRDVDHIVDLQLGGSKTAENLWSLDSSVNRSFGVQIQNQIKNLPVGTVINRVTIGH